MAGKKKHTNGLDVNVKFKLSNYIPACRAVIICPPLGIPIWLSLSVFCVSCHKTDLSNSLLRGALFTGIIISIP